MSLCIKNANVLVNNGSSYGFELHTIRISNHTIDGFDLPEGNDPCIDLCGQGLLPTLFNVHCHLGESCFRDISGSDWTIAKYLEYTETINGKLSQKERNQEWLKSARYTIEKQFQYGCSGICAARSADICQQYNMNNMAGYPIMNTPKLSGYLQDGLAGFKSYFSKYNSKKCSVGIFFHSLYMNDFTSLELAKKALESGAEFMTIHVSEDMDTTEKEKRKFGKTAICVLDEWGLLSEKTILVHCGFATVADLELISQRGATIAICPISNMFLNTAIPDIRLLDALKIRWFVATDGVATGRKFSLIAQAAELKKHFEYLTDYDLYQAITSRPARLFNRNVYTGEISLGGAGEFLLVDNAWTVKGHTVPLLMSGSIPFKMARF